MATTNILEQLSALLAARREADPSTSYVARLYAGGADRILKKVGEEAAEVIIEGKNSDDAALVYEVADLWFHCMVLLASRNLSAQDVLDELARREGLSGLAEKAARPAES